VTKKQIQTLDSLPDRAYCSVAICHKGTTLARIDQAVLHKRVHKPIGFAWCIESVKMGSLVYICPDYNLTIFENNHFRVDI
jgi:hypothetical protein